MRSSAFGPLDEEGALEILQRPLDRFDLTRNLDPVERDPDARLLRQ
jgi:hypothetical protein